jgi:hypothetical protein
MRHQKTPSRFEIKVYTPHSTLIHRRSATKRCRRMLRRTATAPAAKVFSRNLRLSDYVMRTRHSKGLQAAMLAARWCNKRKNTRENDYGNALQTNSHRIQRDGQAHPQIALGWIGRESGAVEKELEQHAVTDTVVSIQNETD